MTDRVRLLEVDDVLDATIRGRMVGAPELADGFPREEDVVALDGRDRGALAFVVVVDGVVVGTCGTHGPPELGAPVELGWGLVEGARGRGIGSAAVRALLVEVRRRFPATPIVARTEWIDGGQGVAADSPASESILTRVGFAPGPVPTAPGEREWRWDPPGAQRSAR